MRSEIKSVVVLSALFLSSCKYTPETYEYSDDNGITIELNNFKDFQGIDRFYLIDNGRLEGHSKINIKYTGEFCTEKYYQALYNYLQHQKIPLKSDLECD